ncbi:hypothetical protein ACFE04_026537 [Oxalis oulophora]
MSNYSQVKPLLNESGDKRWDTLFELELAAEKLLLAKSKVVENDKARQQNREALTALRKIARTTKTSLPLPFDSIMKDIGGSTTTRPLVKEVCTTCGNHDTNEKTWMLFPGTDLFVAVPFHVSHTVLEEDLGKLDYEAKKLQSYQKEKSLFISEMGALSDKIDPAVLRSLVALTGKRDPHNLIPGTKDPRSGLVSRCIMDVPHDCLICRTKLPMESTISSPENFIN